MLPRSLARRRRAVRIAKYALPVLALALLTSIAAWPEISRTIERGRVTWHELTMVESNGAMKQPRYRGFDAQNQPFMISAQTAVRAGPDRYNLRAPRADLTLHNGAWLQVQSRSGVYVQKSDQLDLSDHVTLYRQDGTILTTATATADMKKGAVTSSDYTHAEGPFGTLDAEGFTLVDRGGVVQFHGPAKLVLNAAH
ncbi:MAG: LPS export ABC transporter periplasmic protein LptC [Rhodospirillales bacterium]